MNSLTTDQVYNLVREDASATVQKLSAYSGNFRSIVEDNWNECCTSLITGSQLFCREIQFRLAHGASPEYENYWPSRLGDSNLFVPFIRAALLHVLSRERIPVYINFSPSFAIDVGDDAYFIYSSRSNFACLTNCFLVHDFPTLHEFCDNILSNFSLTDYVENSLSSINRKYDSAGALLPLSLTLHLTVVKNRIFGIKETTKKRPTQRNKGISDACCNFASFPEEKTEVAADRTGCEQLGEQTVQPADRRIGELAVKHAVTLAVTPADRQWSRRTDSGAGGDIGGQTVEPADRRIGGQTVEPADRRVGGLAVKKADRQWKAVCRSDLSGSGSGSGSAKMIGEKRKTVLSETHFVDNCKKRKEVALLGEKKNGDHNIPLINGSGKICGAKRTAERIETECKRRKVEQQSKTGPLECEKENFDPNVCVPLINGSGRICGTKRRANSSDTHSICNGKKQREERQSDKENISPLLSSGTSKKKLKRLLLTNSSNHKKVKRKSKPMRRCETEGTKLQLHYNCIWEALSAEMEIASDGNPKPRFSRIRKGRKSKKIAQKLKTAFEKWYGHEEGKKGIGAAFGEDPITQTGFRENAIPILERFLSANICIYTQKCVTRKKISGSFLKLQPTMLTKIFKLEYVSKGEFKNEINLLSDGQNHIKCIVDTKKYSSKFECLNCLMCFGDSYQLKRHKCTNDNKFIGDSAYNLKQSTNVMLKSTLNFDTENDIQASFVFLTIERQAESAPNGITVKTDFVGCDLDKRLSYEATCVQDACNYVLKLLPPCANHVLGKQLAKNASFVGQFETELNLASATANESTFLRDERVLRYEKLLTCKKKLVEYFSAVTCYVHTPMEDITLLEEFMFCVLKSLCLETEHLSEISLFHATGKLSKIEKKSFPIIFCALNYLSPVFMKPKNDLVTATTLKKVNNDLSSNFAVQLQEINTVASLGKMIMANHLPQHVLRSLRSPSVEMQTYLSRATRFGLLSCVPREIGPQFEYKAGISLDVSKYYLTLLTNCKFYVGKCLKYRQSRDGNLVCNPTRCRSTFANMLMLTLERVCKCVGVHTQILAREIRLGHPIDCLMSFETGPSVLINYEGCLFHGHGADSTSKEYTCHKHVSEISKEHLATCKICQNNCAPYDRLRPKLYRFGMGEDENSVHPVKKTMTHKQVLAMSQQAEKTVRESCPKSSRFITITECEIIEFFYTEIGAFLKYLGLPCKPEFETRIFRDVIHDTVSAHFPLFRIGGYTSICKNKIMELVKSELFGGYIVAEVTLGKKSQELLGSLRLFDYKTANAPNDGFCITDEIISTEFLKFLLDKLPDVRINNVTRIFEYKKALHPQFADIGSKLQEFLKNVQTLPLLEKLLKASVNACIGSFNLDNRKYNQYVLLSRSDALSIEHLKKLIKSCAITEDIGLFFFQNRSPNLNVSHLNFQLVSFGRAQMADFILQAQKFLNIHLTRVNTDGCLMVSTLSWPPKLLQNEHPSSVALDFFLKSSLCEDDLEGYLEFKTKYFVNIGYCPEHYDNYRMSLLSNKTWSLPACCINFRNVPKLYEMKIELLFDNASLHSVNNFTISNTVTKKCISKCSGLSRRKE